MMYIVTFFGSDEAQFISSPPLVVTLCYIINTLCNNIPDHGLEGRSPHRYGI